MTDSKHDFAKRAVALADKYISEDKRTEFTLAVLDVVHDARVEQIDRCLATFRTSLERAPTKRNQLILGAAE